MIRTFLDASTGHLSAETWQWLDANFADDALRDPANLVGGQLAGGKTRYGWFVYAPSCPAAAAEIPDDLAAVLNHARGLGCEYVLFDCDAPAVAGMPMRHPDFACDTEAVPC